MVGKGQIALKMETLLGIPLARAPVRTETVTFEGREELALKSIRALGRVNRVGRLGQGWTRDEFMFVTTPQSMVGLFCSLAKLGRKMGALIVLTPLQSIQGRKSSSPTRTTIAFRCSMEQESFCGSGGSEGIDDGQFKEIYGVTFDHRAGQIVVADTNNHRIQIFDEEGTFLRSFGQGHLSLPGGIAIDPAGNYFVSDAGTDCIQVFDYAGTFVRVIGSKGKEMES